MVKNLPKFHRSQSGQALIILLLIMVVGLTVGLSIATRTITDLRISTQSEESQKAFSAAEAGIEDALRRNLEQVVTAGGTFQTPVGTGITSTTTVTKIADTTQFVTEQPIAQDDVAQVNLDPPTSSPPTSVDVYWADENDPASSLEITLVYYDGLNYQIQKWAYNTDSSHSNGFTQASDPAPSGGKDHKGKVSVSLTGTPKILRFRPFYGQASVAVVAQPSGSTLPLQSYKISSTGTTGQITRKIEVTRSLNALPPIFDYVLYSGTDITK